MAVDPNAPAASRRIAFTALMGPLVLCFAALPGGVEAAWVVDPAGRFEVRGDDNVRLSPLDEQEGIISSVTGQVTLRQVTERSEVSAIIGGTYLDYSEVDLDAEDIEFLGFRGRWIGERATYGVRGSVRRDVLLRTAEALDDFDSDSGDLIEEEDFIPEDDLIPEEDIDVGAIESQVRRVRTRVRPFVDIALGQRTGLGLSYQYYASDYEDDPSLNVQDGEQHEVGLELQRNLSEISIGRLAARAGRFDPEFSETVDSYEVVLGLDRNFSERLSGTIEVGGRRAETDQSSDSGMVLRLNGVRRFERGNLAARLERSLAPSPFGDIVERDTVNLSYTQALTDHVGLTLRSRAYRINRSIDERSSDRDYVELESQIQRALGPSWAIGVSYRYRWVDRQDQPDSTSSNAVSVFLSFQPPSAI